MRNFTKRLLIFSLPIIAVFLPPAFILFRAGEFYDINGVAAAQLAHEKPVVFGPAYSYFLQSLRQAAMDVRAPEVLAVGSSRVGYLRAVFFNHPGTFYNAAGATLAMSDFRAFIEYLPNKPRIVIAGMDQYFFNPENAKNAIVVRPNPYMDGMETALDVFFEGFFKNRGWLTAYADYAQQKFVLADVLRSNAQVQTIGMRAAAHTDGHINDGSYYYGTYLANPRRAKDVERSIAEMTAAVTAESGGYEYGPSISQAALAQVRDFLEYCKAQNIHVIGVLPPMPHAVYEKMKQYPNAPYARGFRELAPMLTALYAEYGYTFFDASDPAAYGSSDLEMSESKHASEKLYARIVLALADLDSEFRTRLNIPLLTKRLQDSSEPFQIFTLQELTTW